MDTVQNRTIYPYELDAEGLISAEHSLRAALGVIQKKSTIKPIFTACPMLEDSTKKLARMLTHGYPGTIAGENVLSQSILLAIDAYESASTRATVESELADAYLVALCLEASKLVNHQVHGLWENGKSERWEHLSMPLIDWAKKKRFERLVFSPRDVSANEHERRAANWLVACQVLTVRDMARLFGAQV